MTGRDSELKNLDETFKKGYKFYQDKNYEKAVELISESIKEEGEHYLKTLYLAFSYYYLDNFKNTIPLFLQVLEQGEEIFQCLLYLTVAYRGIGDYRSSLDSYNKVLKLDLNTIERENIVNMKLQLIKDLELKGKIESQGIIIQLNDSYEKGLYEFTSGRYDKSISFFQEYLLKNPNFYPAYYYKSGAYVQLDEFEKALEDMEKVAELNPKNVRPWIGIALIHSQMGEYEKAIENGNKALRLDPNSTQIKNYLNDFYNTLQKIENLTDKEKSEELVKIGSEELKKDSFQKALQYFNAAIKLDMKNRKAWEGKIQCVDVEKLIELYLKVLKIFPNDIGFWIDVGVWYHKLNQSKEALECFNTAIKLDVNNRRAWEAKIHAVDIKSQIQLYHEVLEIFPDDALFWYETGVWYRRSKNPKKAIEYYEKAIKLDKDGNSGGHTEYMAWDAMGNAYWDIKEYDKAIKAYKKVIQHKQTYLDSDNYRKIGDLYLELNNLNKAIKNYKNALNLNHSNQLALKQLDKLIKKRF